MYSKRICGEINGRYPGTGHALHKGAFGGEWEEPGGNKELGYPHYQAIYRIESHLFPMFSGYRWCPDLDITKELA